MKISFVVLFIITFSINCFSQSGWAIGEKGTILRTTNNGEDWQDFSDNISNNPSSKDLFFSIFSINKTHSWIGGGNKKGEGVLAEIDSSEKGWNINKRNLGTAFGDLLFFDENIGWALDVNGIVYKTSNSGEAWTESKIGNVAYAMSLSFTSKDKGFAVGYNKALYFYSNRNSDNKYEGIILNSDDGGKSWKAQAKYENVQFQKIRFIDSLYGWAIGQYYFHKSEKEIISQGIIYRTTNCGVTWELQKNPSTTMIYSIYFFDRNIGWVVDGDGKILKTTNSGQEWFIQNDKNKNVLISISFLDEKIGCAVGDKGTILITSDGGTNWNVPQNSVTNNLLLGSTYDKRTEWELALLKNDVANYQKYINNNPMGKFIQLANEKIEQLEYNNILLLNKYLNYELFIQKHPSSQYREDINARMKLFKLLNLKKDILSPYGFSPGFLGEL